METSPSTRNEIPARVETLSFSWMKGHTQAGEASPITRIGVECDAPLPCQRIPVHDVVGKLRALGAQGGTTADCGNRIAPDVSRLVFVTVEDEPDASPLAPREEGFRVLHSQESLVGKANLAKNPLE